MATPTTLPASFSAGAVLTAAQMNNLRGAFRVLQVVSAIKTDTFTTTSTSFVDVTGLTISITPSSTSSLVLVFGTLSGSNDAGAAYGAGAIYRGTTPIFAGAAASNRTRGIQFDVAGAVQMLNVSGSVLDNPASTSALTYSWRVMNNSAGTFYVNRSETDTDTANYPRGASSITAMEISA